MWLMKSSIVKTCFGTRVQNSGIINSYVCLYFMAMKVKLESNTVDNHLKNERHGHNELGKNSH